MTTTDDDRREIVHDRYGRPVSVSRTLTGQIRGYRRADQPRAALSPTIGGVYQARPMARPMSDEERARMERRDSDAALDHPEMPQPGPAPEPVRLSDVPCASAGCLARSVYARSYCVGHLAAPERIDDPRCTAHGRLREIAGIIWPPEYHADPDEELPEIVRAVAAVLRDTGYAPSYAEGRHDIDRHHAGRPVPGCRECELERP